jgi:hypothetical protein
MRGQLERLVQIGLYLDPRFPIQLEGHGADQTDPPARGDEILRSSWFRRKHAIQPAVDVLGLTLVAARPRMNCLLLSLLHVAAEKVAGEL